MRSRISTPQQRSGGFTLVEVCVALVCLAVLSVAVTYCFLVMNKLAVRNRDLSSAKALCQESIEQALTLPYDPPNNITPAILTIGTSTPENVRVYVRQDNTTVPVTGTRTVTVGTASAALKLLQVTVLVSYTYQSKTRSYQMATLRAPD